MGKKYEAAIKLVDQEKRYTIVEACELLEKVKVAKFDETVDVAARLGVNPKHADQMIRSSCSLPHGTGKSLRVVVFAKGDRAAEARDAGADFVGAEDLVERVFKENWLDFDSAIATPDMMGLVGRLGRVLGPRNLMPNPKVGTVTMDVARAVREIKAGRIEFRTEKTGIVHAPVGKVSFGAKKMRGEPRVSARDPAAPQARHRQGQVLQERRAVVDDGSVHQARHQRRRRDRREVISHETRSKFPQEAVITR
jgi:large subunit ribosomal protein L1